MFYAKLVTIYFNQDAFIKATQSSLFHLFFPSYQSGETALHSVSGIPQGRGNEDDHVNVVQILLEHGANLTFTTYQVISLPLVIKSKRDVISLLQNSYMITLNYSAGVECTFMQRFNVLNS